MVGLLELFGILLSLAAVLVISGLVFIYVTTDSMPNLKRYDSEKYFKDPSRGESKKEFPSIRGKATKNLSVIVPSYNEEERLPTMLDETLGFLEERLKKDSCLTFEIIVVDDGSRDKTSKVALDYSKRYGIDKVRVLTLAQNRGKGGAVRLGVLSARGEYILFADADGATHFPDIVKLESAIKLVDKKKHNMTIVCGSRAHLQEEAVAKRSFFRTILMYGFHFAVMMLCQVKGIKDTQCGFKLFSREAALRTFFNLHVERWAFDVELLYIAEQLGIPIVEVSVNWTEIDGSKMIPVWSWIQMGKDLLLIRLRYFIGVWKIDRTVKS